MKNLTSLKGFKILALVLLLSFTLIYLVPSPLEANVCHEALTKCGVDAILVAIFNGPASGVIYFSGCLIGYDFCTKYFLKLAK
ncbi:MAG: hypothetical protein ACE5GI_02290 [Candidatus Aminicenantales bacterium]